MSPRRKFEPGEGALLAPQSIEPSRRWGLPLALTASAVVMAAAISACALMRSPMNRTSEQRTRIS